MALTLEQWKARQHRLNVWVKERKLEGLTALIEDGDPGPLTRRRIRDCHFWLGYSERTSRWSQDFAYRLRHTFDEARTPPDMIRLGIQRRRAHNRAHRRSQTEGRETRGVASFDGKQVAAWLVPYLRWARENGWQGVLVSGWRDPVYSEGLCVRMCGRPSCPGRCAGRSSNHSGSVKPSGAIDVSDYARFGQLMRRCPHQPTIFNALGARDPVHFSTSGR